MKTDVVPFNSLSCSTAGSHSSSTLTSSFRLASSASLLANDDSASLIALASERRVASSSLTVALCSVAVGAVEGLVADVRAESRTRDEAIRLLSQGYMFHECTHLSDWNELLRVLSSDWLWWPTFVALSRQS